VAQKFHFEFLGIAVTRASRGLSAIAELLVLVTTRLLCGWAKTVCRPWLSSQE